MRRTLLPVLALFASASLLGQASAPPKKATPTPRPSTKKLRAIPRLTGVSPLEAPVGSEVTLTGRGLDQGSMVLFGSYAPSIVEQTEQKIVVRMPADKPQMEGASLEVFLITPGLPVVASGYSVRVVPRGSGSLGVATRIVPTPPGNRPAVDEEIVLVAKQPKSYELAMAEDDRIIVNLGTGHGTRGEVSIAVGVAGEKPSTVKATYGGSIIWKVNTFELTGGKEMTGPMKATVTLTTDAATLPVKVKLMVHDKSTPNAIKR